MDHLRQTYRFIQSYHARLNAMPTQREIGTAFGLTPNAAKHRLNRMKALGWLNYGGQRAIVLKGLPQRELES